MVRGEKMREAYEQLSGICRVLSQLVDTSRIYLDFSTVNDMNYYNGITFRGFVKGIPDGVLSGGRYDTLMHKMGKSSGAIGFAVYLDMLQRLSLNASEYDVDNLVIYDEDTDELLLAKTLSEIGERGESFRAQTNANTALRAKKTLRITREGVQSIEGND